MKESELPVGDTFRDSLQLRLISSYSSYTNITRQTTSLDNVEGLHISSWIWFSTLFTYVLVCFLYFGHSSDIALILMYL